MTKGRARQFNQTMTRVITDVAFGVACYEGGPVDDQFVGTHRGVCQDWEEAEAWLRGETPPSLITVYDADRDNH